MDALIARYDGAGDGARIGAADFCERLLAPDFPTAAEKAKRRADGVVSAFRRAFKDEVSRRRDNGIDEDDDAATVSTRDALSAAARAAKAAKCRTLGASAARAAAATSLADSGRVRVEAFVAACQRSIREAEALALKHAPFREPTGFEALGGEHYAPVSARTPPPFPAKPDVARFLRMARDKFAERVPLKGASETTKCARLFDPDRLGYVTPASFRRAMASLGLDAIDEETFAKTFARVAKEAETVSRNAASAVCSTSAFVRAFLPARVAVDRPARGAVLAALEQSEAARRRKCAPCWRRATWTWRTPRRRTPGAAQSAKREKRKRDDGPGARLRQASGHGIAAGAASQESSVADAGGGPLRDGGVGNMGRIPPVHALVPADAAVRDGLTKKRYAGAYRLGRVIVYDSL